MAEHASFGVTSRSRCVDEAAALAWLLSSHLGFDDLLFHCLTNLQKVLPEEEARARDSFRQCSLSPNNEGLDPIVLVEIDCEALKVFRGLDADNFSLAMRCLIKTRVSCIRNVDARVDVVVHHATNEGDGPLR